MSAKFDIPINFTVSALSENDAAERIYDILNRTIKKYGLENVIEYEYFEFVAKESCNSGCGNNHCC